MDNVLKRMVEKAIGNDEDILLKLFPYKHSSIIYIYGWYAVNYETSATRKCELIINSKQLDMLRMCHNTFSLPDLIDNDAFMESVTSDEMVCHIDETDADIEKFCGKCKDCIYYMPTYRYHQQQLIILDDDQKLEYIKNNILGEG
jgi:hypothetical protein